MTFLNTEELAFIVFVVGLKNLRTFIYACQKTKDIFEKVGDISLEKKKCIFYSMIVFSKAVKSGTIPKWEGSEYLSVSLGVDRNFPLYRFCYDYIVWHEFNNEDVQKAFNAHELLRLYDERGSRNDDDMRRISDFSNYSEKEIRECLKRIESRLDDPEEIPYYAYGELAYCLTLFNLILDFDYTACREKMINNIQGQNIDLALLFLSCTEFESDAHKDLFEKFKMDIILSVQKVKGIDIDWNYDPDKIEELEQYVDEHEERILTMHRFISSINVDKMVDFVFRCCPEQLGTFRRILRRIYKNADWLTFDADEGAAMKIFTEKIEKRKEEKKGDPTFDKIVLLKINWLIGDLKEYERNLCR